LVQLFFGLGLLGGVYIMRWQLGLYLKRFGFQDPELTQLQEQASDRMTWMLLIGCILGARLGHVLFYEPGYYLKHPIEIIAFWNGGIRGLASHGGAFGLLIALGLFYLWQQKRLKFSYRTLLDILAVVAAFVAFWIRIGNFFNQEIVGVPTDGSWGVVFGHPAEAMGWVARHPVQLYEASVYGTLFVLLIFFAKPLKKLI
jgi:Prolipoprotein diacylglyceryltransferase